jgi:1-acyl-sn-glycerol-3-phosphate acyltransferase
MVKRLVYQMLRYYCRFLVRAFFGKVEIIGQENIPKDQPVIYSSNHQNAFMDALIIGGLSPKITYSVTRSDVFKKKYEWFMDAINMIPIYRIRDGFSQLAKNEETFRKINRYLSQGHALTIFSEGNHGNDFFLRSLSKGSSRMALEAQEKMDHLDLQIIPVGLNYFHHQRPLHKISIVYGQPISVKDFIPLYLEQKAKGVNQMKETIERGMRTCLLIPQESPTYLEERDRINRHNESRSFEQLREGIPLGEGLKSLGKPNKFLYGIGKCLGIFNFGPLWLLQSILSGIKDIVFYGSMKWALAMFIFPIWFLLVLWVGSLLIDIQAGLMIALMSILMLYLRQYLIKWSNMPH